MEARVRCLTYRFMKDVVAKTLETVKLAGRARATPADVRLAVAKRRT